MTENLTVVKEALDAAADRVHTRAPQREEIDRSLRRVRRRRRVARVGKGIGALGGVAALLAAVQVGMVPVPAWVPVPVATAASALADGPTRGSLAGDAVWLRALREKVANFRPDGPDGERWAVPSPGRVDVVYAGDLGDYRVAVVETPLRRRASEMRLQLWYVGVRGAGVPAMQVSTTQQPADVVSGTVGPGTLPDDGTPRRTAALVLGAARDVQQVGPVRIAADGSAAWPAVPVPPSEPGVWEVVVPPGAGQTFLRGRGFPVVPLGVQEWGGESPAEAAALVEGATPALRTGSVADRVVSSAPTARRLASSMAGAQYASGLRAGASTRRLLWSGTVDGTAVDLVEVIAPSGGRVLVAVQDVFAALNPEGGLEGGGQLVAATGHAATTGPGLAWVFQQTEPLAGGGASPAGPHRVVLVGPADAVAAQVTTVDGAVHPVDLPGGGPGVLTVEGARSVRFLDGGGRVVLESRVTQQDEAPVTLGPPALG